LSPVDQSPNQSPQSENQTNCSANSAGSKSEEGLLFYLTGMFQENSLLQSYRIILGAVEAILFAFLLALNELQVGIPWSVRLTAIAGILWSVFWVAICHHRGNEVGTWRDQLVRAATGTDIGAFLDKIKMWKGGNLRTRVLLNYVMPGLLMVAWAYIIVVSR